MLLAFSIFFSVVVWAWEAMAKNTESHFQSVTEPLPRYPRPRRKKATR